MATRLKTVEYWFPHLTTLDNTTDTNLTQITVYLPESSKTFKSVFAEAIVHDRSTGLGNVTRQQLSLQLGSAGYDVVNNTTTITNGGEQQTVMFSADFTSTFTADWSGTSMTCDARLLLTRSGTVLTPAWSNASVRLVITYEYDDTTTTHVKTVRIPLNLPVGAMATTQPGSALATIPALDTHLPEASKTIRQTVLILQGNDNGSSVDLSFSLRVGSGTTFTSQAYEHASNCAMFIRLSDVQTWDTSTTQGWFAWCPSAAVGHHMQAWLVVTYEFDSTSSNDLFVSLVLPMEVDSPMGGTTSADYQRATRELMIQEAGVTGRECAFYCFWDQLAAIAGLNMRIGTGSFVSYTDAAAVLSGSNAAMVRNDSAFTLARGRNTLNFDVYRSDTADLGYNVGGFWIVNYTCDKPTAGHGSENHSIEWGLGPMNTVTVAASREIAATAITIPETAYYVTAAGVMLRSVPSGTVSLNGTSATVERLASGEGGLIWERAYADIGGTDGETGIYHGWAQVRALFKRWPGDADTTRLDLETARRWRVAAGQSVSCVFHLSFMLTYHSQTYAIADTVSNSSGGTVTCHLCRASTGDRLLTTSRTGDGAIAFTWYDDTEDLFIEARESDLKTGRSGNFTA